MPEFTYELYQFEPGCSCHGTGIADDWLSQGSAAAETP